MINALAIAKGATVKSSGTSSETGYGTNFSTTTTSGRAEEDKIFQYDGGPVSSASNVQAFGGVEEEPAGTGVGSTNDFLNQLYGNNNNWSKYTF